METSTTSKANRALLLKRCFLFVVCGAALLETILHFAFKNRAPTEQQWKEIRPRVEGLYSPGDIVAVAPQWGEPLAREALGDSMMPLSMVARADDDAFPRVVEIDILGQRLPEFSTWPIIRKQTFGKFDLSIRKNPSWQKVRFDAVDHVDSATLSISIQRPNGQDACSFSDSAPMSAGNLGGDPTSPRVRFSCPGGTFHWVGVTIIDDEHYRPRRCIWAPPSTLGNLVLRFQRVPFGKKLVGHAGAPWLMVRDGVGPPIQFSAASGNGTLGSVAARDTDGWIRFEWNTERLDNTIGDLELRIAQVQSEQRFCFALEAR